MSTQRRKDAPAPLSQRELDMLKVLAPVLEGKRTQAEAARLLDLTPRHVRRLVDKIRTDGDAAIRHGLRGRPSNRQADADLHRRVLKEYRNHFHDFGPTLACEKLAERGLRVGVETLRCWLIEEGLWQPGRRRDTHRKRRARRECFGELVQMDTSIHDWTEGRGEPMVLVNMIDDATSRVLSGFHKGETVEAHFELLGQWLRLYGRPLALYTDRDSIFEYQSKGRGDPNGLTQFGRALQELGIDLILARSPQAKGRVERFFETAQDRWVKEMRLAGVRTREQANALARSQLIPQFNRRFTVAPVSSNDAHQLLGREHNLAAILSVQHERVVGNDYTVRFENRIYQVGKPIYPGLRKGRVVIELRLDGTMAIRFDGKYLKYQEIVAKCAAPGGSAPQTPRSLAHEGPTPTGEEEGSTSAKEVEPPGVQPTGGRSGRTSAEPYPPDGAAENTKKGPRRPAANHPWRKGFKGM
jgi:Helix-turn-helix domain